MDNKIKDETHYNIKGIIKYISTVVSWTLFIILIIIAVLLFYYYISVKLYASKGDKFEPKFSIYTIVSPSMEPNLNVYDVIVNTKVNDINDVKVNDVITFISTWNITYGMTITHRVVGVKTLDNGDKCLVTRGDNNTQNDPTCVEKANLIGVTKAVIPGLGNIQQFLSNKTGFLVVIIIPALFILIKDILKMFNLKKDIKKEKENIVAENKDKKLEKAYDDLKKVKNKKKR